MKDLEKLIPYFKDKYIQIYLGEQYEQIQLTDHTYETVCVIYGKFLDIVSNFLIIDCFFVMDNKEIKPGNKIFINAWMIKAITELDEQGSIDDILLSGSHSKLIKILAKKSQ